MFSGVMVFITGFIFISFYILLLAFSYNEDVFCLFRKKEKSEGPWGIISRVVNLVIGVVICAGIGYWFYAFTDSNIVDIKDIKNFNFTSIDNILAQLFENYIFVIVIIAIGLFLAIVWFAALTQKGKIKKGVDD